MRLSPRCYAVTGLGYVPPWTVNAGFIVGDETTLICDTGANAAAAATIHGYALAVRPANRLRVLNLEKHFDHIGGNRYFADLGVEIWGHKAIARTATEFAGEIDEFNDAIPMRARKGEARVFFHGTGVTNPVRQISGDTRMELGACPVEILLTPGHTTTNISVWVPEDRVLFAADCLINLYTPNLDAGGVDDWRIWLLSIERLRALHPVAVVCGHGPVAAGNEVGTVMDRVSEVLRAAIRTGKSPTA